MTLEWINPVVFRWISIGIWLLVAAIGLFVCGGNWREARFRARELFGDGPPSAQRALEYRYRIQRRLLIAMVSATTVGLIAAATPRPEPPTTTATVLVSTVLLLGFIALITSLSIEIRRYEDQVIRNGEDDEALKAIAAQLASNSDIVARLERALERIEAADLVVAQDLDEAQDRADAVGDADPGEAADAWSQSGED